MNSYQTEYLDTWNEAFAKLLDWSEEQTASWAEPLLENLERPGMVLNEPPLYYVARELAHNQICYDGLSQTDKFELIRAVQDILAPDGAARNFPPDFDFGAAKNELDGLLGEGWGSAGTLKPARRVG